ncbi:hypothetical protein R1sor_013216 [Riccia sorocarpa]|uniref:EIPR1-like beta-propeller domain-containing protein n=1 Tax=Riccia sorocarpa TaxID=122646 RepID=A0ABD3H8U5_9MARC
MQGATAQQHASAYGVKYQARCIAPYVLDSQRTRFLVGTQSLREENEVHLITLPDNSSDIICEGLYTHQHEIWDLAVCPFDPQLISTVYASVGEYGAALWRIPDRSRGGYLNVLPLENVASLNGHTTTIKCTLWWPSGKHNQLLSIDSENLFIWDLVTEQRAAKIQARLSAGELHHMAGGAWDPHDVTKVATAVESSVVIWDLRSMKQSSRIEQAHAIQVRDIDFNPKREDILITSGDDSKIRVWDVKMPGMPLRELPGHSHWTWRVRYNPVYEELVLSAGTDSVVNLWHVTPVSSSSSSSQDSKPKSPYGSPKGPLDSLMRAYTEHEDSVYGIAWSARDPWVFASLSYDGRVMVDSVPQNVRQKITNRGKP